MLADTSLQSVLERPGLSLTGRILLTSPFWASALLKLYDFGGTIAEVKGFGLPAPALVAILTICVQAAGSVAIISGHFAAAGAAALGVFTLMASLLAHTFWQGGFAPHPFAAFMANMGLIGGLILAVILSERTTS